MLKYTIPTGYLFVDDYQKGKLETLSIGDYGKKYNVKADFLGFKKEIHGVPNIYCMPLSEKWVITLSTQYGCVMKCTFCLPPGTKILDNNYKYQNIEDLKIGNKVLANINRKENSNPHSLQYASSTTTVAEITGLIKRKYSGQMYTIKTIDGQEITCTDEHPIAVNINSRMAFLPANEIKVGDEIIVTEPIKIQNWNNKDFVTGWMFGFIHGDGSYDEIDGKRWQISQKRRELLDFLREKLGENDIITSNIWGQNDKKYGISHRFAIQGKQVDKLNELFPSHINDNFATGWLSGFWDAEGFAFKNNQVVRICNKNPAFIKMAEDFANQLGYKTSSIMRKNGFTILSLNCNRDIFIAKFTPRHHKKEYLDNKRSRTFSFKSKVSSISTEPYDGIVYNIETSEHSYYANNILTHNCDVPKVEWGGNATFEDLMKQLLSAIRLFPTVKYTERLNIHFARMGEPIFNDAVFEFATYIYRHKNRIQELTGLRIETLHPVLTTSLPKKFKSLRENILRWCDIKNNLYNGQAGLQFSINSTNEDQRTAMFAGMSLSLEEFSRIADSMPNPVSRKYCLNFAYSTDFEIDASIIKKLFDPNKFMCKITPIHNNNACKENNIATVGGYDSWLPYQKPEQDLKRAGFDVLVFVPSIDEEDGLVTCGNAITGGSKLKYNEDLIKIEGL